MCKLDFIFEKELKTTTTTNKFVECQDYDKVFDDPSEAYEYDLSWRFKRICLNVNGKAFKVS